MKNLIFPILAAVTLLMTACPSKKNDDPTPTSIVGSPNVNQWVSGSGDSIHIDAGSLVMKTKYVDSLHHTAVVYNYPGKVLKGDFEIKIAYSDYKRDLVNPLYDAFGISMTTTPLDSKKVDLSTFGYYNNKIYLFDLNGVAKTSKASEATSGEFCAKRTAGVFSSWFRAGSDTLFCDRVNYTESDVDLGFSLNTMVSNSLGASVKIDDVQVIEGGGTLKSDSFDDASTLLISK